MSRNTAFQGFTLIELVIVIVILGILAVVAIPTFIDLGQDAQNATTNGVAGALSSANAENYAARVERSTNGIPIPNCTAVASMLVGSTLPSGYSIVSSSVPVNTSVSCILQGPRGTSAVFRATGIT